MRLMRSQNTFRPSYRAGFENRLIIMTVDFNSTGKPLLHATDFKEVYLMMKSNLIRLNGLETDVKYASFITRRKRGSGSIELHPFMVDKLYSPCLGNYIAPAGYII